MARHGIVGLTAAVLALLAVPPPAPAEGTRVAGGLARTVREATAGFRDIAAAEAAGYVPATPCVSGPQEGAMGIHYANPALVADGQLDPRAPELLIYERRRDGALRLVGVEFLVLAEAWDAAHDGPPALEGQLFHYSGSPNRYRLPPFYELHVWAWRPNPHGTYVDWHPHVTCDYAQ